MEKLLCNIVQRIVQLLWLELSAWRHWNKTLYAGTFSGKGRDIGLEHAENRQAPFLSFRQILCDLEAPRISLLWL